MNDEPKTDRAMRIRHKVGEDTWRCRVEDAEKRSEIVKLVLSKYQEEAAGSLRDCQENVAPTVHWSTFLNWRRRYESRTGPGWERLLDGRCPEPAKPIQEDIRESARDLRRADRSMNTDTARQHLIAEFGQSGNLSDASLRRIWADADLRYIHPSREYEQEDGQDEQPTKTEPEEVEYYNGGAGLALLGAAESELQAFKGLAEGALEQGEENAQEQGEVRPAQTGKEERNDKGQFTADYNRVWREPVEPGESDGRWDSDREKRQRTILSDLATLKYSPDVLGDRLLCMGVIPVITERRGFAGLGGPAGDWLGTMGVHPYMPATLEKQLSELSLLDVGESLWGQHARQWNEISQRWSMDGPAWQRIVVYVDSTQDPYWTRKYAASGSVSRIGRVMPCLSRVALASGPGVPLIVETYAGTVSLKNKLLSMLRRLDQELGEKEVGRLTVVDSEAASAGVLWSLQKEERGYITVLKGAALKGSERREQGNWEVFRDRDEVRELTVTLRGKGAPKEGLNLRGVEMQRRESRHPKSTIFLTTLPQEELSAGGVAAAYLSRWPNQEQLFRDGRNGGGLNRSHGYGGELVTHIALQTKIEQSERRVERTQREVYKAEARVADIAISALETKDHMSPLDKDMIKLAEREQRKKEKALEKAQDEFEKQCTTPREIFIRDTSRDNIMTCLKLGALLLVEYVLKEYFGSIKMQWRTFIEEFNLLPVTVRTTASHVRYQIHASRRNPKNMERLVEACDEINRRAIRRGTRFLQFEVMEPPKPGS